jgi:signal transduction histidine kinase
MDDSVRDERRRLAARLHDGPLQSLTAAQLLLDSTLPLLTGMPVEARNRLEQALAGVRDANGACRALVDELDADA